MRPPLPHIFGAVALQDHAQDPAAAGLTQAQEAVQGSQAFRRP
jgi:hypothetical protein